MSFICHGEPEYDWAKKVAALDATAYMNWRPLIRSMGHGTQHPLPALATEETLKNIHTYGGMLMDAEEIDAWNSVGVDVKVSRVKGIASDHKELAKVTYQISIANVGLLGIQLVDVLEDACTDELQRWLDRGWRLLAVCPPNDTRRPTYIMGHCEREGHR